MKTNLLTFWDKNPRSITDENLEKLKRSLKEDPKFLEKRKMLVNRTKQGKKEILIVYAGNQRLKGLIALGYDEIPDEWIDIEDNISEELMNKRAFKDNTEYGRWDIEIIKQNFTMGEIQAMDLPEYEVPLSIWDEEVEEEEEENKPSPITVTVFCSDMGEAELVKSDIEGLGYECKVRG